MEGDRYHHHHHGHENYSHSQSHPHRRHHQSQSQSHAIGPSTSTKTDSEECLTKLPESFEPSNFDCIVGWARQNYQHGTLRPVSNATSTTTYLVIALRSVLRYHQIKLGLFEVLRFAIQFIILVPFSPLLFDFNLVKLRCMYCAVMCCSFSSLW